MTTGSGTLTDEIYLASLDPARAALITQHYNWLTGLGLPQYDLTAAAKLLATAQLAGGSIDTQIMLWGWPAPMVMQIRENQGYAYTPPYGSANININPGVPPPPGETSNYPASMPAGWIKVSTDAADYPAWVAPVVPTTPVIWTPEMNEMQSAVDPTTGLVHYFFGFSSGQNPALGTPCTYNGLSFVAANVPGTSQQWAQPGVYEKAWMLVGVATGSAS